MTNFRLFLTAASVLLVLGHYFLYRTAVRFFEITSAGYRAAAGLVLVFLALSFILASFAVHQHENFITRAFYFGSGVWLGLFVNLMMAAAAGWAVIWAAALAGHRPGPALVGGLLFGLAALYSAYGVWNAFHPQVKSVRVSIKGLPASWKGRKIVQLSDVHLGHVYKAGFMEDVVATVNGLHPDIVAVTGDLFDGMDGDLAGLAGPLDRLEAPYGVYFVTGNHETYVGVGKVFAALAKTRVAILDDKVVDIGGLQLVGVGYQRRGERKDVGKTIKSLPGFVPGMPTVLLYHAPLGIDGIRDAGVNLQLSGHTHKGQIFPFGFITRRVYKGYDYGLHSLGDYSIYTTDGVGAWGPPMRTGNTPEIVEITLG